MSEDIMNLHLVEESNSKIIVHPSVPIQILELFYRSAEQVQDKSPNPMKDQQIMGILLGRILPDQVQITNCYIIKNACLNPDDYPAQVKSLIDQNTKMYQKEVFLGNFFTYSNSLTNDLITLHHMLNKKILKQHFQGNYILPSPIYIGIDPVMSQKSFNIKAFTFEDGLQLCSSMGICPFKSLHVEVQFIQEKYSEVKPFVGIDDKQNQMFRVVNLDSMKQMILETIKQLESIQQKVQEIIDKKRPGDAKLGLAVKQLLNLTPIIKKEEYTRLTEQYKEDSQLIVFLSNYFKIHGAIQDKLKSCL